MKNRKDTKTATKALLIGLLWSIIMTLLAGAIFGFKGSSWLYFGVWFLSLAFGVQAATQALANRKASESDKA